MSDFEKYYNPEGSIYNDRINKFSHIKISQKLIDEFCRIVKEREEEVAWRLDDIGYRMSRSKSCIDGFLRYRDMDWLGKDTQEFYSMWYSEEFVHLAGLVKFFHPIMEELNKLIDKEITFDKNNENFCFNK